MKLYPAIDLLGGRCVRLYQGDYDRSTTYGDDPAAQASAFAAAGAAVIHIVDLDAARTGEPTNRSAIAAIAASNDVPLQVGGGVRTREAAEALFELGVARVVIGTAALENPALVGELTAAGRAVAVGLDARGGEVATHGWTERTGATTLDVARRFADLGVAALVVTDIDTDGTMAGPDIDGLTDLLAATEIDVVASGGVGTLDHLRSLHAVRTHGARRLEGVIVGRALYEGAFTVAEAIEALEADR